MADFVNNSTATKSVPTGVPDPRYPGYDTAGYLLGTTSNQGGGYTIPNPVTGMTSTTNPNSVGASQANPGGNPFATFAPTGDTGGNGPYGPVSPGPGYPDIPVPDYLQTPFSVPQMPQSLQTPFSLPTNDQLQATPGYMSRYQMGLDARQRAAAAQGTLLNGGTLKALDRYGQDYASNEYGNLVNQELQARGSNLNDYQTQVANALAGRQQQVNDWSTLTNQPAQNRYGSLYQQYMDLIANNRNSQNDYTSALLNQAKLGAGTATAGNPGTGGPV